MTKEFIDRARKVHGNKYDYSKVVYKNISLKVIIICPKHGNFLQSPGAHIHSTHNQGCPKCGWEKISKLKLSTNSQFIEKAKKIHNGIYDYSKVNYKGTRNKVIIICPIHGKFKQNPSAHLIGQGCQKCGKIKSDNNQHRLSNNEFIKRSKRIHGNKYNYSKANYINWNSKIIIICPKHGNFKQTAFCHFKGSECPKCNKESFSNKFTKSTEQFIQQAKKKHGNKYLYNKVKYVYSLKKVIITCLKHGNFYQTPQHHLEGANCPKCSLISSKNQPSTLTTPQFIEKALKVHGNKYNYYKTIYINGKLKVIITCPKHGDFCMRSHTHLEGQGCPTCRKSKGELKVEQWLIKNKIVYTPQASFPDCRGKKYPLRFDFYLPNNDICMEIDGPHHYKKTDFYTKDPKLIDQKFSETLLYDRVKNDFCKKQNIELIRIRYDRLKYNYNRLLNKILGKIK